MFSPGTGRQTSVDCFWCLWEQPALPPLHWPYSSDHRRKRNRRHPLKLRRRWLLSCPKTDGVPKVRVNATLVERASPRSVPSEPSLQMHQQRLAGTLAPPAPLTLRAKDTLIL